LADLSKPEAAAEYWDGQMKGSRMLHAGDNVNDHLLQSTESAEQSPAGWKGFHL
jgi:hypothetical protein